jgi:glycine/D-amino acid oxidase-like deaminating enzyme/nitrite reductase/ring-hydroxylating ferredoxin subunit
MASLWLEQRHGRPIPSDALQPGAHFDAVVAGAGLTGLSTALLLARAGLAVAVLEARFVGAVTSGNTTAKLSLLHGRVLSGIRSHASEEAARAYIDGNREGQQWLLRYLAEHGVAVQQRDAWSYAATPESVQLVDEEYAASRAAGLAVTRHERADLPFETHAAIRLPAQAQFDPLHVLAALARDVREHGGVIVEGARVSAVDVGEPCTINTARGTVTATTLVLATGTPILDRGLHFATLTASRSYALAFSLPDAGAALPRGMYLSLDTPTRSLRTVPVTGEELLLVGGNGHPVGRGPAGSAPVDELVAWTVERFAGAELRHAWSAQDYRSVSMLPTVGWMPRSGRRVAVATGYNKWGMTNAVAAALTVAADVLGGHLPWAEVMREQGTTPADVASAVAANAQVGAHLAGGWLGAELSALGDDPPAEGEGRVGNHNMKPTAVSTVDGATCRLSAVCTHLGGVLSWNPLERSWDCPLHGSRFNARGTLLEGPATADLEVLG